MKDAREVIRAALLADEERADFGYRKGTLTILDAVASAAGLDGPGTAFLTFGEDGKVMIGRAEPAGFMQPGVAYEYRLHSACSGKPQKDGQSLFYDHSRCAALYRLVVEP